MSKPLIVDKPYPTTDDLCPDACAVKIISPAYATSTGELNAILQYTYQAMNFSQAGMKEYAETLESIAVAEMFHFRLLGRTILALGAQPVYTAQPPFGYNFYSTKFVGYTRSFRHMIEDDIMAENHTICGYDKMLCRLNNDKVKEIVIRITEDEKLHLTALQAIYADVSC